MTASSTPCCRRGSWLAAVAALWLALLATPAARASGIEVREAALVPADDGYYLDATFEIVLPSALEEALNKGVPLHFLLEFELIRPRWYWLNEKLVNRQQRFRLTYNALTRQYRVGVDTLYQNTVRALQTPDTKERMGKLGAEPMLMKPAEFDAYIRKEIASNAALVKAAGVTAN